MKPSRERRASAWQPAAALALTFASACDGALRDDASLDHHASSTCELRTPADWQRFLTATVDDERWVSTCASGPDCDELLGEFRARIEADVLGLFERCADDVTLNPRIDRCTERLRRFVPAWVRQRTQGTYGFALDNAEYFAAQAAPHVPPGMMEPPSELLGALPERAAVERAARDAGWPYLTHDSGVGGVRTFVAVDDPDGRYEQWLLVGLQGETTVPDGSVLSLIGVQKTDAAGRALERVRLHFRDYRLEPREGSWSASLPVVHDAKCYACHSSGLRALIASHGRVVASEPVKGEADYGAMPPDDFGFERLRSLNERLIAYGVPDWNGTIEPADHGPPLGESLGCTTCHDGITRGVLNLSTDEATLRRKVVDELSMRATGPGRSVPDERAMALLDREATENPPLTEGERAELERARADHLRDYEALVAERFPAWRTWALEVSCLEQ